MKNNLYLLHIETDGIVFHRLSENLNSASKDAMVVRTWNGHRPWGGLSHLANLCPLCRRISIADAVQAILGVE